MKLQDWKQGKLLTMMKTEEMQVILWGTVAALGTELINQRKNPDCQAESYGIKWLTSVYNH